MIYFLLAAGITGCANYTGQERIKEFLVHPESWLKDPHYAEYKENSDTLESKYLAEEITYSEYVDQKKMLDEKYDQEVKERNEILGQ
jgi:hypothetical protein